MAESGGYDAYFVRKPSDFFECIICHLVLRNALMFVQCGHRVCSTCFQQMRDHRKSEQERNHSLPTESEDDFSVLCPHDRIVIHPNETVPDISVSRAILEFKVKCGNHLQGCEWIGELRELERHASHSCHYRDGKTNSKLVEELSERVDECEKKLKEKDEEIVHLKKDRDERVTSLEAMVKNYNAETEKLKALLVDFIAKINLNNKDPTSNLVISEANNEEGDAFLRRDQATFANLPHHQLVRLMNVSEYILGERTVFTWKIANYHQHFHDTRRELDSPRFYVQPLQCCVCRLKLVWFGQRKGRIAVRLHMCSVYSSDHCVRQIYSDKFEMAMKLEICGKRGERKSHFVCKEDMRENVRWELGEYGDVHDILSSGFGVDDLLGGGNVNRYVVDDALSIECTLFESNPKECC